VLTHRCLRACSSSLNLNALPLAIASPRRALYLGIDAICLLLPLLHVGAVAARLHALFIDLAPPQTLLWVP